MSFKVDDVDNSDSAIFGFGINQKKAAAQLRKLADEIEAGDNDRNEYRALQRISVEESMNFENYAMTTVRLEFATLKRKKGVLEPPQ